MAKLQAEMRDRQWQAAIRAQLCVENNVRWSSHTPSSVLFHCRQLGHVLGTPNIARPFANISTHRDGGPLRTLDLRFTFHHRT